MKATPDSQKQSTDSLRTIQQALDLLSTVVENSEDAIYAQDEEGRYLLFNQAACRFMGKTKLEVLGNDDYALFPAAQAEMLTTVNQRIMATGKPETIEGRFEIAGGERYFVVAKRPLCDHDGRIIGTFGIARDITARKQVEDALAEREERFRTLASNIPGAVYRCELTQPWRVSMMSEGVLSVTGHAAPEFLRSDNPLNWAGLVLAEDLPRLEQEVEAAIAQNRPYSVVYRIQHADTGFRWVLENGRAIYDPAGTPLYLDGVIFDVTDLKQAEEELRLRNVELERFNRATIGRELDMLELKKRINALNRELGRPPPYSLDFLDSGPDRSEIPHGC